MDSSTKAANSGRPSPGGASTCTSATPPRPSRRGHQRSSATLPPHAVWVCRGTKEVGMDFRFSQEEEAFRQELRTWLDQNVPANWEGVFLEEDAEAWREGRAFVKRVAPKGGGAAGGPKEYGGGGGASLYPV